ncbi:uncharacterized protein LOC124919294 [Impatiens glandulifera]|uniref:uncharacterized protein LOC124919294 n=1 Tax=Impatiens glandulifera TaxID=253017 RepID=UPI001FB0DF52|nr:uncharacterized protein LOC124919294 [Impatiens glandulifera]
MAWLARSIANSLRLDEDDEHHTDNASDNTLQIDSTDQSLQSDPLNPDRGVKEDLSELTKTLTRQFWGVASFLAPPPPPPPQSSSQQQQSSPVSNSGLDPESSDSAGIAGIRSDFAEIGGRVRSGISKLSNNINVSEITKIASNFLQLGPEGDEEYESSGIAVGVTEEVVEFVRDIAMHPDTWLDFPLLDDSEENDDEFDMSDIQQEHALAVERLAPRLAALRIELCPGYMTEGLFWKIYFILLHPKLNKHDADLLSTPQIVKARASLTQEMQSETNSELESISNPSIAGYESISLEPSMIIQSSHPTESNNNDDFETDKHPVQTVEIPIVDKSVVIDQNSHPISSSPRIIEKYEDDGDDWLKEEEDSSEEVVGPAGISTTIENEEDVSFSDLEEDDDIPSKKEKYGSDSSNKDSRDWVQLSRSSTASAKELDGVKEVTAKESNDWLDIDEIDMD